MARSKLLELLRSAPAFQASQTGYVDHGVADVEPFPFPAIVGQYEMKLALTLAVINPAVGGVLLLGPRGTAKTTAVRSLTDLLPVARRSLCENGCSEDLLESGGISAICDTCAQKVGYGEPLTSFERVHIVNLPLNARLEDVVGGIDERLALEQHRLRLERGILSQADGHILYIDEVNMLDNVIANAILDAASQGFYSVRRGPQKLSYRSNFLLLGSMNPEEGTLRPQLFDRFGLRAVVRGLQDAEQRYLAYEQAMWYRRDPEGMAAAFAEQTMALADEIDAARTLLERVSIGASAKQEGLRLISEMGIESSRAEITLFEAARAFAAGNEQDAVTVDDIFSVAALALRFRHSATIEDFLEQQEVDDARLNALLAEKSSAP